MTEENSTMVFDNATVKLGSFGSVGDSGKYASQIVGNINAGVQAALQMNNSRGNGWAR